MKAFDHGLIRMTVVDVFGCMKSRARPGWDY